MGSKKRASWARQKAEFAAGLNSARMDESFARESRRSEDTHAQRQAALRKKTCESKNRYDTRAEAQENLAWCKAQGIRGLSIYRCPYCDKWHLTSH